MERVFICSPFRGAEEKNVELARKYARFAYEECREVWVFGEIMSEGMCMEIAEADHAGIPIRYFTKQNGEFVERSSL